MYTYVVSAIDSLGFPSGHCRKHTVVPDLQIHSQTGHNLPPTRLCDLWTPPDVSDPIQTRFVCPAREGVTKKTEDTQYQLYKTDYLILLRIIVTSWVNQVWDGQKQEYEVQTKSDFEMSPHVLLSAKSQAMKIKRRNKGKIHLFNSV